MAAGVVFVSLLGGCGGGGEDDRARSSAGGAAPSVPSTTSVSTSTAVTATAGPSPTPIPGRATLVAAGDVASCASRGDEATAALVEARPDATVAVLGDSVYERGSQTEYANCYGPTWGRFKARTRPAPGNHEYATSGAAGYYGYFGSAAGDPDRGYYSYDLGAWHVVVLNSNCGETACGRGSAQDQWLRADVAAHRTACALAYWHHPRFSSGAAHGSTPAMGPLWSALFEAGVDVVLAGHDHTYERFAPLDEAGNVDPERGVRSFVVGTGGRSHYGFREPPLPGSEVRNGDTFGVLSLSLGPDAYDWEFVPTAGWSFTDRGSSRCH